MFAYYNISDNNNNNSYTTIIITTIMNDDNGDDVPIQRTSLARQEAKQSSSVHSTALVAMNSGVSGIHKSRSSYLTKQGHRVQW